jgi:exopolysaccharide production protein ExoQ
MQDQFVAASRSTVNRYLNSVPLGAALNQANWEDRGTWLLWLCCAFSLVFIIVIPTVPAAIFLCAVILYCAFFPLRPYRALTWNIVPWVIVLLGLLSALWSEQPMQSLRSAPQIAVSVLAAIMIAQGLPARSFISVVLYAFIASNAAYLFIPSVFGSKNMVGQSLALVMLSSFWVMFDRQQSKLVRTVALLAFLATPPMLLSSNSEGALLAGGLALLGSVVPFLMRRLHSSTRIMLTCLGVTLICLALGFAFLFFNNLFDVLLLSIGKDVSLTGRTLLWSHAATIIADHPFGVGLQAFWVESNSQAVQFWETFYIKNHYGFHFHDLWLEMGVELGVVGILIAAGTTLVVFFSVWRWVLRDPRPESCFFAGFVTFVVSRTLGEVELYGQFSMTSVIFMAAYYYADSAQRNSRV